MTATVDMTGFRARYPVVKRNRKTILVVLDDGNIIKRHMVKHNVELFVHKSPKFIRDQIMHEPWYARLWNWLRR